MTVTNPNQPESLVPLQIHGYDTNGITPRVDTGNVDVRFYLSRPPTEHEVAASDEMQDPDMNTNRVNLVTYQDTIVLEDLEIHKLADWVRAANTCLSIYESEGYTAARLEDSKRDAARRTLDMIDFTNL